MYLNSYIHSQLRQLIIEYIKMLFSSDFKLTIECIIACQSGIAVYTDEERMRKSYYEYGEDNTEIA